MIRGCDIDEGCVSQWLRIDVSKCFAIKLTGRLCLLVISDGIPIKYHQYDCPNVRH